MQDFKKLKVWEQAHSLTLDIYVAIKSFPKDDEPLKLALCESARMTATNIAVGSAQHDESNFLISLEMAKNATVETEYLLMLACDLQYISTPTYKTLDEKTQGVKKMLTALAQKIEANL